MVNHPNRSKRALNEEQRNAIVRWCAKIAYRHDAGPVTEEHYLEEIGDLAEIVERGPHWDTVIGIEIKRSAPYIPDLTVEAAAEL